MTAPSKGSRIDGWRPSLALWRYLAAIYWPGGGCVGYGAG